MIHESGVPKGRLLLDYSTTNVTSTTWVLVGALPVGTIGTVEIYDSGTQVMELKQDTAAGTGAGNINMWVLPGGNGRIPLRLDGPASGSTMNLYVRAQSTSATTGKLIINLF